MTAAEIVDSVPEPLLVGLVLNGLSLVLLLCALGFVFLAMPTD